MARTRRWYEDVMDVALRAALKELGFKRKSHATYIREHSPDRVWAFELQLARPQLEYFSDAAGVFVPAIEEAFERFAPDFVYHTNMRTPTHVGTDIEHMVRLEKGWDTKAWYANPKSTTWLGGYRRAPKVDTVLRNVSQIVGFNYNAAGSVVKVPDAEWHRRLAVITEELGHDLDAWWRKYVLPWLHDCDDPLFLAEWMDDVPRMGNHGDLMRAVAYHLAGDDETAAARLRRRTEEAEKSFETIVEELTEKEKGQKKYKWDDPVEESAKKRMAWLKKVAQAARALADGLGIKL